MSLCVVRMLSAMISVKIHRTFAGPLMHFAPSSKAQNVRRSGVNTSIPYALQLLSIILFARRNALLT